MAKGINIFFAFSTLTLLTTVLLTTKIPETKKILVKIEVSENDLTSLNDPKNIKLSTSQYFESINFPPNSMLQHATGRPLGFQKNFFLSLYSEFEVADEQSFDIIINSDDGYRLFIDERMIGEFTYDRPAKEEKHSILLKSGKHQMTLDYFQGFGNAALQVKYKPSNSTNYRYFGVDSPEIKFTKFEQ